MKIAVGALIGLAAACGHGGPSKDVPKGAAPGNALAAPAPATGPSPVLALGQQAYDKYCQQCHGNAMQGYLADSAPSLVNPTFLASTDEGFLRTAIEIGRPGTAMGAYTKLRGGPLGNVEIDALIKLIQSKGTGEHATLEAPLPGEPARGAAIYEAGCKRCHGDGAQRMTALSIVNAGFLASASDGFLAYAITHGRPGTPMVPTNLDAQQVGDVIAFLRAQQTPVPTPMPPQTATTTDAWNNPVPPGPKPDADLPVILNPRGRWPVMPLREARFVAVDDVKKALDGKKKLIIVDARPVPEWIAEHLAGAISIPYYELDGLSRLPEPQDDPWIVAYCACPHHLSGILVDELVKRGYKHALVLDEGITVWKQRGYPMGGQLANQPAPPPVN